MTKSNIKSALYGFLSRLKVNLGGQLYGGEALSLLLLPFINIRSLFKKYPILRKVLLSYILMLSGLIFSDLYNNTGFFDFIRGWLNFVFSFISVIVLVDIFDKNNKNIIWFLFFYAISSFLFGVYTNTEKLLQENSNYFKVMFEPFLTPLLILSTYYIYKYLGNKFLLCSYLIITIIYFLFDARSVGLSFFISFLFLSIKIFKIKLRKEKLIFISIIGLLISYGSYALYVNNVLTGEIGGKNALQIKKAENPYNPMELLYYGRTEFFVAIEAISDNPILGYGSWAKDESNIYNKMSAKMANERYIKTGSEKNIPAHSIIATVWLWGGVVSFIGICILLKLYIKVFFNFYKNCDPNDLSYLVLIITLSLAVFWDFLFSPLPHLRLSFPQVFAFLIIIINKKKAYGNQI